MGETEMRGEVKSIKDLKREIDNVLWRHRFMSKQMISVRDDIFVLLNSFEASVRENLKEVERLELTNINASVELALGAQKVELRRILGEVELRRILDEDREVYHSIVREKKWRC